MIGGAAVLTRICFEIGLRHHFGAGEVLLPDVASHCGLVENIATDPDPLDSDPQIIGIAEEIWIDDRHCGNIRASQLDGPASLRAQHIRVQRHAGPGGNLRHALFDARADEEMELQVGGRRCSVAVPEGAALDDVGGDGSLAENEIFESSPDHPMRLGVFVEAVGPAEFVDDIDAEMIVQVSADAGKIHDHG